MSLPTKEQRLAVIIAKEEAERKAAHEKAEADRIAKLEAASAERKRIRAAIARAIGTAPGIIAAAVEACATECVIRIMYSDHYTLTDADRVITDEVIKSLQAPDYKFTPLIDAELITWDDRDWEGGFIAERCRTQYHVAIKVTWEN